jgi:tripartite-type tricarboxylate transporter receptor subunit TctC
MKMITRDLFFACFLLACLSVEPSRVQAQSYPSRPIQIVVSGASGDALDVGGRLLAQELEKILQTQIVIVNKPGGGSSVGADFVAKSKNDGYTLLYTNSSGVVYNPAFTPETTPYETLRDFEPLAQHVSFPTGLWVSAESPWKNLQDVIDYSQKNPGKFRCGMLGLGSIVHFKLEMIKSLTGADITLIPFKGAMPSLTALLGGHTESSFTAVSITHPHYQSKKVRGILLDQPLTELPDVPTLQQLGYKRGLPLTFNALFAPAGIPQDVKKVLAPAIERAANDKDSIHKLKQLWFIPSYKAGDELKHIIAHDYENARELVKRMGMTK